MEFELLGVASAHDFYLDEAQNHLYLLGRIPESLYKIDLARKTLLNKSPVCTEATKMAVSQIKDSLVIPCFKDNRVSLYTLSSLTLSNVTPVIGRGPSYCVIDEPHGLVYCTFTVEGIMVIFDDRLNYQGYIFNKAPRNQMGS